VAERFHLVVREDNGFHLYSPQIPELVAGRETREELYRDLPDILSFAAPELRLEDAVFHKEAVFLASTAAPEGDFIIRAANDDRTQQRRRLAQRVGTALQIPTQREDMLDVPRTPSGFVLFVCALPADTIRWITEQLDPRGEVAVVVAPVAEEWVWTSYLANVGDWQDWRPLEHWGWTLDTTVAEMMTEQVFGNRSRQVLVAA
jgi:predicted RNase H-like HicB family nuclease